MFALSALLNLIYSNLFVVNTFLKIMLAKDACSLNYCLVTVNSYSYLVDPASSHMLVSKIKPCMSKYILLHGETANGSLNQLWFLRSFILHG